MRWRPLPIHVLLVIALGSLSAAVGPCGNQGQGPGSQPTTTIALPGLEHPARVRTDAEGVRHLFAENDLDLSRLQGYVHARDRFFQMDLTRRETSGDLAELMGPGEIGSDIQNRTIGLRRAAKRSLAALTSRELALLEAFSEGVNWFLATNPLPPAYAELELTTARPWEPVDTLVIGKGIAASLSIDIDFGPTEDLEDYIAAGIAQGFDGEALLFEDVNRFAPMDPVATVPDATSSVPFIQAQRKPIDRTFLAKAAAGAKDFRAKAEKSRLLRLAMNRREFQIGSNEWGVAAAHTEGGHPIIANDPHLSLGMPSTFYEIHLVVADDPVDGPMNVSGATFPGAPAVILGQNERITWGATTNGMDVTDLFIDRMVRLDPDCPNTATFGLCIVSEGQLHPVKLTSTTYFTNQPDDGVLDNVIDAKLPLQQILILTVPFRSFGAVVGLSDPGILLGSTKESDAFVLQYTGFHATREVQAFRKWNRAQNLTEFVEGLQDFDFGSQNWAYADADGNLAYFTSAELPLRADLEAGAVVGLPPFFVRDGSGPNNWIPDPSPGPQQAVPFEILPFAEMPQTVNPANGFFVNANNDPAGTTLDNDPLNQRRLSDPNAIYYLNPRYAAGLRAGRITRLIQQKIDAGEPISFKDMQRFQANTQQLDAELMVPFLLTAFENASTPGAASELAAVAGDARVAEAAGRLSSWDFSTPTGIAEGYDASDVNGARHANVTNNERDASVAATIYNLWRAKLIGRVVDSTLAGLGVPGVGSGDALKAAHHLLSAVPFTGVGASGVDFFPEPAALSAAERRDAALLAALREALDALASDTFAPAFGNSTDQDDYRWGKLHRKTFGHELGGAFSLPPAAGFADLAPDLPGLSRDGGYQVVNASGFSARAQGLNSFRFGGGPVRRYVGEARPGGGGFRIKGHNVMPGGPSGDPASPLYATQLGDWLTADYHKVTMGEPDGMGVSLELFEP